MTFEDWLCKKEVCMTNHDLHIFWVSSLTGELGSPDLLHNRRPPRHRHFTSTSKFGTLKSVSKLRASGFHVMFYVNLCPSVSSRSTTIPGGLFQWEAHSLCTRESGRGAGWRELLEMELCYKQILSARQRQKGWNKFREGKKFLESLASCWAKMIML